MLEVMLILLTLISFPLAALYRRNKATVEERNIETFIVGQKDRRAFPIAAGISMSFVGGAATLNMASLGYQYGWSVFVDPVVVFFALLVSIAFASRVRNNQGITIAELLTNTSPAMKLLLGVTSFFVYQLLSAAQFVAVGKLLSPYFPNIPLSIIIIIPALIVFFYIFLRGFNSVTNTDVLQLLIILTLFFIPVLFAISLNTEKIASPSIGISSAPLSLLIYLALPLFFVPVSHDTNIRIKAAKSLKHARWGLFTGGLLYVLLVGLSIAIGVFMKKTGYAIELPEETLPIFFSKYLSAFRILATIAVLAAIVSTLDSFAFDSIVSISNDIFKPLRRKYNLSDNGILCISTLIVLTFGLLIALVFQQILGLILAGMLIYVAIFIPVAVGRSIGLPDHLLVITSIITGIALVVSKVIGYVPPLEPLAFILLHILLITITKLARFK